MTVVIPTTLSGILLAILVFAILRTDNFQTIVGWIWLAVSTVVRSADRNAVRFRVQGEVNTALNVALASGPREIREGKLRIRWVAPDQARSVLSGGDVVVCLHRSQFHEENVANAVIAYLPLAIVPRARRYVARRTMQAVDLVLAKSVVDRTRSGPRGSMQAFLLRHVDPAIRDDAILRKKVERTNAIDITGWLTRLFLDELRVFGDRLYPGESDHAYVIEADRFHSWLYGLSVRPRGMNVQLWFSGKIIRAGVIMVARTVVVEESGVQPYLRWVDRYVERFKVNAIYVIASDTTIPYAKRIVNYAELNAKIDSIAEYEYRPRPEFRSRVPLRRHVFCAVLRYRPPDAVPDDFEDQVTEEDLATLLESVDELSPPSDEAAIEVEIERT